jgi:hypothetical protein
MGLRLPEVSPFRLSEGPFAAMRCYPVSQVDPLSAVRPFEGFSPRASALSQRASSHGLHHDAGRIHRRNRSPEYQRTRGAACLFRELPPSLGLSFREPANESPVFPRTHLATPWQSVARGVPLRRALGSRCERSGVATGAFISSSVGSGFRVSPPDASRCIG